MQTSSQEINRRLISSLEKALKFLRHLESDQSFASQKKALHKIQNYIQKIQTFGLAKFISLYFEKNGTKPNNLKGRIKRDLATNEKISEKTIITFDELLENWNRLNRRG